MTKTTSCFSVVRQSRMEFLLYCPKQENIGINIQKYPVILESDSNNILFQSFPAIFIFARSVLFLCKITG